MTPASPDAEQLQPAVQALVGSLHRRPRIVLADAGYWSEANVVALQARGIAPPELVHITGPQPPAGELVMGILVRGHRLKPCL